MVDVSDETERQTGQMEPDLAHGAVPTLPLHPILMLE